MKGSLRMAGMGLLLWAGSASAQATPLALGEGQVAPLVFERKVTQVAVSDSGVVAARAAGSKVDVVGVKGGSARLTVELEGGLSLSYDVRVAAASRPARPVDPHLVELRPGEERRLEAPGMARVMVEDNGVARARAEPNAVVVTAVTPGTASLLVVQESGTKVEWTIRVRP